MVRRFGDKPSHAHRAFQIWQILIGAAHNRQTLTYGMVADILGFRGAGVLAEILGHIMFYCIEQGLPVLTVLVVNKESGGPGDGIILSNNAKASPTPEEINRERERVFNHDWYGIYPPCEEELAQAFQRAKAGP